MGNPHADKHCQKAAVAQGPPGLTLSYIRELKPRLSGQVYIYSPAYLPIYLSIHVSTCPEGGFYTHSSVHLLLLIVFYFGNLGAWIRTNSTKLTYPMGMGLRRRLCYAFYMGGWFFYHPAFFVVFIYLGRNLRVIPTPNQLRFLILIEQGRPN